MDFRVKSFSLRSEECFEFTCAQHSLFLAGLVEEKERQQISGVCCVVATLKPGFALAVWVTTAAKQVFTRIILEPLSY